MPVFETNDGSTHEFPDTVSPATINSFLTSKGLKITRLVSGTQQISSDMGGDVTSGTLPQTGDVTSGVLPDTTPKYRTEVYRGGSRTVRDYGQEGGSGGGAVKFDPAASEASIPLVATGIASTYSAGAIPPAAAWLGLLGRVAPATAYLFESAGAAIASGLGAAGAALGISGVRQLTSGKAEKPSAIAGEAATAAKEWGGAEALGRGLVGAARSVAPVIRGTGEVATRMAEALPGGKVVANQLQREISLRKLAEATGIQEHVLVRFENAKSRWADMVSETEATISKEKSNVIKAADRDRAALEYEIAQNEIVKQSVNQEAKTTVAKSLDSISGEMRPDVAYQEAGLMARATEQNFKQTADTLEEIAFAKARDSKAVADTNDIAIAIKDMVKGDERVGGVIGQYTKPDKAQATLERNARKQLKKNIEEDLGLKPPLTKALTAPIPAKPGLSPKEIEQFAKIWGESPSNIAEAFRPPAGPVPIGKAWGGAPQPVGVPTPPKPAQKAATILNKGEVPIPALMRARENVSQAYYDPSTSKEYAKRLKVLLGMIDSKIASAVPEFKAYTGYVAKQKTLMEQTIFQTIQNEKTRGMLHLWVQPHRPDAVNSLFEIAADSGYAHMIPQVQRNFLESLVANPKTGELALPPLRAKLAQYGDSTINALFPDTASKQALESIKKMSDKLGKIEADVSLKSDKAAVKIKELEANLKVVLDDLAGDAEEAARAAKANPLWIEKRFGPEIRDAQKRVKDIESNLPKERGFSDALISHAAPGIASAALGAGYGYHSGGAQGAIAGGVAGLTLPYVIVKIAYNPKAAAALDKFLDVVAIPGKADPYATAQAIKAAMATKKR